MKTKLSRGIVGAISEHIACADLMAKGFEVYGACSPHSSCDIIAMQDGHTFRVEVRTCSEAGSFPFGARDTGRQDCVCTVTKAGAVAYYAVTHKCPASLMAMPMPQRAKRVTARKAWAAHPHAVIM